MTSNNILVTGGLGYIGSHTVIELYKAGYTPIIYDNLDNSNISVKSKIDKIIKDKIIFIKGDIRNIKKLEKIFKKYNIDAVIHFAGLKSVKESCEKPLKYYNVNVSGTITLLETMKKYNCNKIVFSSSATVYGNPKIVPIKEDSEVGKDIANPYGRTKYFIEEILKYLNKNNNLKIGILRYFNSIGAHKSGLIGDNPIGIPNNLMPYIGKVAIGNISSLDVYGNDYNTIDGTGVRDYIHVTDLAKGHIKTLEKLQEKDSIIVNLGSGIGYSVKDIINTFERVNGIKINYSIKERRPGDIAISYADTSYAKELLNWKVENTLEDMCRDSWNFIKLSNKIK